MHKIPTEHIFNRFQIQTNFIKAIRGDLPSEPLRVRDEEGPSRELDSSWIRNKRSIYFHSSVTLRARFQTYCIQFTLYARSLGSTARQSSSSSNLTQAAPELFLRGNASLIQKTFRNSTSSRVTSEANFKHKCISYWALEHARFERSFTKPFPGCRGLLGTDRGTPFFTPQAAPRERRGLTQLLSLPCSKLIFRTDLCLLRG